MEWYEYDEAERIREVYSKFTIENFFTWLQHGTKDFYEVRIMDFQLIKKIGQTYGIPYSTSGLYVNDPNTLKLLIKAIRANNVVAWFSVNPRKKSYNQKGFKSFSGKDVNTESINHVFIDIDRTVKNGPASMEDLKNADFLATSILNRLSSQGWNKRYLKVCSGNGVQLLISLDVPIIVPNLPYDMSSKTYSTNAEFECMKKLIKEGIGKEITVFSKKFKEDLKVEVDTTCFKMGCVASLPFTKNFKYGGFTWRGIIDMQNGKNEGLSDYCLLKLQDIKLLQQKNVFVNHRKKNITTLKSKDLLTHPLIRFMLDNDLPSGMVNNLLWMQVKCLLRDNNLTLEDETVKEIHSSLCKRHKRTFTMNFPEAKYEFKEEIINRYCADNMFKPVFPLDKLRVTKEAYDIGTLHWDMIKLFNDDYVLEGEDFFDDMKKLKSSFKECTGFINNEVYLFLSACIKKYGEEKTKYFFDYWIERYIGWR